MTFGEIDTSAIVTNFSQAQDAIERILTAANNGTQIPLGSEPFLLDLAEVLPRLVTRDVAKVSVAMVTVVFLGSERSTTLGRIDLASVFLQLVSSPEP